MEASVLSLPEISSDVLHQILLYVQGDFKTLYSMGCVNRYFQLVVFNDAKQDILFLRHRQQQQQELDDYYDYDYKNSHNYGHVHKQYWKNRYQLQKLLTIPQYRQHLYKSSLTRLNTLKLLSPQEELQSLSYCHSGLLEILSVENKNPNGSTDIVHSSDNSTSNTANNTGYFGFSILPEPANRMAVWGDFSGISLIPCRPTPKIESTIRQATTTAKKKKHGRAEPSSSSGILKNKNDDQDSFFKASPVYPPPITTATSSQEEDHEHPAPEVQSSTLSPSSDDEDEDSNSYSHMFGMYHQVMVTLLHGPFLFLGFASGQIHVVVVIPNETNTTTTTPATTSATTTTTRRVPNSYYTQPESYILGDDSAHHSSEISSLCPVHGTNDLISASVNGTIILHYDALLDGYLDDTCKLQFQATRASPTSTLETVLSLASCSTGSNSTTIQKDNSGGGGCLTVGRMNGMIHHGYYRYPTSRKISNDNNTTSSLQQGEEQEQPPQQETNSSITFCKWWAKSCSVDGHVVFLKYFGQRLVLGTSIGHICVISKTALEENGNDPLEELYVIPNCCPGGLVESVELVGTICITAGGINGKVRFWDWETGMALGELRVHPGRWCTTVGYDNDDDNDDNDDEKVGSARRERRQKLYSSVITTRVFHNRSCLLFLCRDGHVYEWCFADELEKAKLSYRQQQRQKQKLLLNNNHNNNKKRKHSSSSLQHD